jgi:hypothetical protein
MQAMVLKTQIRVQNWLRSLLNDPIAVILANNSALTSTQLETFVIDILADELAGKHLSYQQKGRLRLLKKGASRGAFNRTLAQARKNVSKSVYTIILLGYLGVFDSPKLDPLIEISNKISTYAQSSREISAKNNITKDHIKLLSMFQKEIEETLTTLSKPKNVGATT